MLNFLKKQGEPVQKVEVKRVAGSNTPVFDEKKATNVRSDCSWWAVTPNSEATAMYEAYQARANAYHAAVKQNQQNIHSSFNPFG